MTVKKREKVNLHHSQVAYAEVAPAVPLPAPSPQVYTYTLPATAVGTELYSRVRIPFGRRFVSGVVVRLHRDPVQYHTKELQTVSPVQLTARQVAFAEWIARIAHGGLGFTLRLFFPGLSSRERRVEGHVTPVAPARVSKRVAVLASRLAHESLAFIDGDGQRRQRFMADVAREYVRKNKRPVLVLVPEQWMVEVMKHSLARAGIEAAAVTGQVTGRAYAAVWHNVQANATQVVVGTQKALFLPWRDLGLIIFEEEFMPTHKLWDQYPRLSSIEAGEKLAELHQAHCLYAGSVASLRLHHRMASGDVTLVHNHPRTWLMHVLPFTARERAARAVLPSSLLPLLKQSLAADECTLVFHNARGRWRIVACKACHHAVRCPLCLTALAVHGYRTSAKLHCHHCGYTGNYPTHCTSCGKGTFVAWGAGTEHVADVLHEALGKNADITELTADTVAAKRRLPARGILVATAAAFRALRDEKVDRVVYLFPERGLLYPDFRSEERTWYTLARLQGLLRNSERPLVLVTRSRSVVSSSLDQTSEQWVKRQLKERRLLAYPPYTTMVRLTVSAAQAARAREMATTVRHQLEATIKRRDRSLNSQVLVRGPFESFVRRRAGKAEAHLLLIGGADDIVPLYQQVAVDRADVSPERIF